MKFTANEVHQALKSLEDFKSSLVAINAEMENLQAPGETNIAGIVGGWRERERERLCYQSLDRLYSALENHGPLLLSNTSVPEFRKWLDDAEKFLLKPYTHKWNEPNDDIFRVGLDLETLIRRLSSQLDRRPPAIFLVHGHDILKKDAVQLLLEKSYEVIVLAEQVNRGQTLIHKFMENVNRVLYAVVLISGDDVGGSAKVMDRSTFKPRARQNVIFELGFFLGRLDPKRVCTLYEKGVEIPSDYVGVGYVPMDGDWQEHLLSEIASVIGPGRV